MIDPTVEIPTRLLVLGMLDERGTVTSAELAPVAAACGSGTEQLRSCLRRLVAEGVLERDGAGRAARYAATPAGLAALARQRERMQRAYALDAGVPPWDDAWHLVGFAIPEAERAARDALRDRLLSLGGAAIQGGLYASPHAWEPAVSAAAKELAVEGAVTIATTTDLRVGGVREPRELARRLWPLAELGARYDAFVTRFQPALAALRSMRARREALPDAAFLPGALAMAVAFQPAFDRDPLLPRELLPARWPGAAARALLLDSRRRALALRAAQGRPRLFQIFDSDTPDPRPEEDTP